MEVCGDSTTQYGESGSALSHSHSEVETEHSNSQVMTCVKLTNCKHFFVCVGWNDGEIRAFTPQTGRLMYEIHNAHSKGVTAIAITTCGHRIVSGGGEGQVSQSNSHWFTSNTELL